MDPKKRNMGDPDAPPTPEEIAAAEALRRALEDPAAARRDEAGDAVAREGADLARAIAAAYAPRDLSADEHRAIVGRALERAAESKEAARPRRAVVVRIAFGVAASFAVAAAALFAVTSVREASAPSASVASAAPATALAPARSTQPLFREPFARTGGESARIDRIARARAKDLRDNRFALRGVR